MDNINNPNATANTNSDCSEIAYLALAAILSMSNNSESNLQQGEPNLFDLQTKAMCQNFATATEYIDTNGNLVDIKTKEITKTAEELDEENKLWKRGYAGF